MQEMTPNQPYLLRAFFDWIIDNDLTPYMVVEVNHPNVQVPTQFVNKGQIVLNLSPNACVNFKMDLEWIEFQARFSGKPMTVSFPIVAVSAIYAKENGAGTVFTVPEHSADPEISESPVRPKASPLSSVQSSDSNKGDNNDKPPTKPTNKPGLRIVK